MQTDLVFSSESVTAGHPDKLCDQISDAIVDHFLRIDPLARVAAECAVSTGILFLSVKSHARATVDVPATARDVLREVGYVGNRGFDARSCTVMTSFEDLPAELFPRIDEEGLENDSAERITVRDQATVFGFACDDTPSKLPFAIWLAHRLARRLAETQAELSYLSPDGKTQVAVEYRDHRPVRIYGISLVACQNERRTPAPSVLETDLRERVLDVVFRDAELRPDAQTRIAINPEGPLFPGGPTLHAGLTGRKTAVDHYGDFARHSSAALSGKDPSRIDRVGSYMARFAAKNVVAAGLARRCELQLFYSIGLSRPVSVIAQTFGTGSLPDRELAQRVQRHFDFRPAAIVRQFGLRSLPARRNGSFYRKLAAYGQAGREDLDVPWERLDRVSSLRGD